LDEINKRSSLPNFNYNYKRPVTRTKDFFKTYYENIKQNSGGLCAGSVFSKDYEGYVLTEENGEEKLFGI
jgi:hypothetical protein